VILPPSEVEGIGDPKVIHWEDQQQELARLWSLSAALQSGRDRKAQLAARLESALEVIIITEVGTRLAPLLARSLVELSDPVRSTNGWVLGSWCFPFQPGIIPGKGWIRLHTFGCASSVKRRGLQRFCVWNRADSSTLAGDLQRILSTMRELDDRAHGDDFSPFLRFFEELCLYFCFSSVCVCNH